MSTLTWLFMKLTCEHVKSLQSCLTLCDPMDWSPPGSSVHGILQARILEWVAIPFSRGIFLTQGLSLGLLHCRQILYHLIHQGSPYDIHRGTLSFQISVSRFHVNTSLCLQCRTLGLIPGSGRFPWRREWQHTPVFLPEEFHGQRSLVGYSPWGLKESDMTERLSLSMSPLEGAKSPPVESH